VRRNKVDASAFLLGAIILLFGLGLFLTINTLRTDPIEEALSGDKIINTLFVIENGGTPLASYVLMYYPATRRATIFDVPGEVGLIIKQINRVDRIDTVYNPEKIAGFRGEIENLLGIDINFSVVFDIENLGKIVDLLEGVELFIPAPVEVYEGEYPVLFPSGVQRLDGDKSRLYITYKLPEESGELISFRGQRFFLGFIKRLGEKNEELKKPPVSRLYHSFLKTGMNQRTLSRLFDELANINVDRVELRSVAGNIREVSGQTLLFPYNDGAIIKDIVAQAMANLTRRAEGNVTDRRFTVQILNGTTINGLAGRTAELLRSFGYNVVSIGNADRNNYETTEIIDRSGYEDMARTFAGIIQCENIRFEEPETADPGMGPNPREAEYKSDFTLIIGRDFNGRNVTGG
jgi:anionic cell wall polymer biosynthesis LytR-Cps2A-Psr (LCP) family protein